MSKKIRPLVGERWVLAHPNLSPKYLTGAVVELTDARADTRGGGWLSEDQTEWWVYEGRIVSMPTPKRNGRFYVGARVTGIRERLLFEMERREEVAA